MPQKIVPNLWFDTEAEEAADFYVSIFPNSEITAVTHDSRRSGPGTLFVGIRGLVTDGNGEATMLFTDLTHAYVDENMGTS